MIAALAFVGAYLLGAPGAGAQAAAEYGSATSSMGAAATGARKARVIFPNPENSTNASSAHLLMRPGPPAEVVNRQKLEENSGKEASKLLLRSTPSAARVWVNGLFVGRAPVLLVLAPGAYTVEMKGEGLESGQRKLDLLPRETRQFALVLTPRYPTAVRLH